MQTVRQAFTILKQNPLLSTISILGTAFAITMIMAIVITWQTKYADLEPEVNRSRCLYFSAMHVYDKYNPQIQISVVSGTKRSIFRQKNKTKRSKKRLHTTLIKPEQKVNEDLCSGFIVS